MGKGSIVVVGDKYTITSFGLVGVKGYTVERPEEAKEVLNVLSKSPDVALVLIAKEVADMVPELVEKLSSRSGIPVFTVIPSRWADVKPVDAASLLKKALGIG